jgi:hypothetical protein
MGQVEPQVLVVMVEVEPDRMHKAQMALQTQVGVVVAQNEVLLALHRTLEVMEALVL